jgi:hypothetical protein
MTTTKEDPMLNRTETLNLQSTRNDQIGCIIHALRRLNGASKGVPAHNRVAEAALTAASHAWSLASAGDSALPQAAALIQGTLYCLPRMDAPEVCVSPIIQVMALLHTRFLTESVVLLEAQAGQLDDLIADMDRQVDFYEGQQAEIDIRLSDGADPSKMPAIRMFGLPCPDHCSMSYGEGTRQDPDRCVNCGCLFERDAKWPFAVQAKVA